MSSPLWAAQSQELDLFLFYSQILAQGLAQNKHSRMNKYGLNMNKDE